MRTMIAAAMAAAMTCALALGAPAAGASVLTPTSGWFWGDPTPQGNQIDHMAFVGARGYAVGHSGAALRSDDGGATWSGLHTGMTGDVGLLAVPSPDALLFASGCSVRRSTDSGATFQRVRFSSSDASCRSTPAALAFLNADAGYIAAADGTVQFTGDGGQSFSARTTIPGTRAAGGNATPSSLFFGSASVGFATLSSGQILRTSDGGTSWDQRAAGFVPLHDLTFADATTAYAVGDGSRVLVSTDVGDTWSPAAADGMPPGLQLTDISCSSASICVAVAAGRSLVLRTSDGWATVQSTTPSAVGLQAASFAGASRVVVAGTAGVTRVSDDAGATFAAVGGGPSLRVQGLRAGSAGLVYAPSGSGTIGVTADGGRSWGALTANTPDRIQDVAFPIVGTGYAVDSTGLVLKTTNAGVSWTQLDSGPGAVAAILAPSTTSVLLLGAGIRRSTDGETFTRLSGLAGRTTLLDADQGGSALFAWGRGTILASTNGGRSWSKVGKPAPRLSIRDLDFVTAKVGFLLDTAGRLYRTSNRGARWTELTTLGSPFASALSFHDASSGLVAFATSMPGIGRGVIVLRTTDGGRSFAPQLVDEGGALVGGLLATGSGSGVVADTAEEDDATRLGTALFATTSGGQAGTPSTLTLSARPRGLKRAGNVVIRGTLKPARGGETVVVSRFDLKTGRWASRRVTATSKGSFSTTWRISRSAAFMAAWRGDDARAGDGSPALNVHVGR